jgi:hypothetical protein
MFIWKELFMATLLELLSAAIKNDPEITGVKINDSEYLLSQYADDSSLILDDNPKSLDHNLNFPEKFHDKCLSGRSCSWQLRLEPSHIASVLSKLTLSPAHSENLLKTNND